MTWMSDRDVAATVSRLRRLGTDTTSIEVKSAAGGLPRSLSETISAFANKAGGLIILGLSEQDDFRAAPGFQATSIRDALARVCSEDMEPPVRADVDILPFEDHEIVVLEVPPLDPTRRPSHIKRLGAYGGSFIRGGDGDRHLTNYEVTQLMANRGQPKDDCAVVEGASLADLDDERVADLLRRLRSKRTRAFADVDDREALRRIGAAAPDAHGEVRPTLAGLLCLGTYPQQFFPQLFISFVALPGETIGDALPDGTRFLDNVTCDGSISEMLDAVLAAARRNMRQAAVIRGTRREDRYDYPAEVIRELVVNALLHRDYSPMAQGTQIQVELFPDRLVIKSPGGIYGSVDPSQLGVEAVSSTRNSALAKLLAEIPDDEGMPVSENRGSGLPRVMTRLRLAGMSPPTFDVSPAHVHVSVPQHALLAPDTVNWIAGLGAAHLSDTQHLALALMRSTGNVSNEMLRAWGVDSNSATTALRDLVDRGLAIKLGGRRYAVYQLLDGPQRQLDLDVPEDAQSRPTVREQRLATERQAVVEAVRAGHTTTQGIADRLDLTYAKANRRVNELLAAGRVEEVPRLQGRARTFRVVSRS